MKKEHPQAKWLRAVADGSELQWRESAESMWVNLTTDVVLDMLVNREFSKGNLRTKPRTITIGKYEVAEPMREAPARGTTYWYITANEKDSINEYFWDGGSTDNYALKSGMCWLNEEDAKLTAEAITELLIGKQDEE